MIWGHAVAQAASTMQLYTGPQQVARWGGSRVLPGAKSKHAVYSFLRDTKINIKHFSLLEKTRFCCYQLKQKVLRNGPEAQVEGKGQ